MRAVKIDCNVRQIESIDTCVPNNFTSLTSNDEAIFNKPLQLTSILIENSLSTFLPTNLSNFLPLLKFFTFVESNLQEITENSLKQLTELVELNLRRNKIEKIDENSFTDLTNLQKLFLDANKISQLDNNTFGPLMNLEEIHLNDNSLEEISPKLFQNNKKLRSINLEMNQLKTLPATIFSGLKDLSEIVLDHNQIEEIPNRIFNDNKKLRILTISYNQINVIGEQNFEIFENLDKHDFLENPCLMDLTWGYDIEEMKQLAEENCKATCENDRKWLMDEIIENSQKRGKRSTNGEDQLNKAEISEINIKIQDLDDKFSKSYEFFKKSDEDKKKLESKIEKLEKQILDMEFVNKTIDIFHRDLVIFKSDFENLKIEERLQSINVSLSDKRIKIFKNQGEIKQLNQTINDGLQKLREELIREIKKSEDFKKIEGLLDAEENNKTIDSTIAPEDGSGEKIDNLKGEIK